MKMKDNKTKLVITILAIIVAILTLFLLSVSVNALSRGEVMEFDEVKNLGDFARYITYKPNNFIGLDINQIFGLNTYFKGSSGIKYATEPLNSNPVETLDQFWFNNTMDITFYSSGMCLFHYQGDKTYSNGYGKIVNVIDINSNGELRVYGNGSSGAITATKDTGDIVLKNESEKQAIAALTHVIYQSSLYERKYNEETKEWPKEGTLTKDVSDDAKISGWNKMYSIDTKSMLGQIKQAISYLMVRNGVDGKNVTKILGEYAGGTIDYVYSGILYGNGYWLLPTWSGSGYGNFVDDALTAAKTQTSKPTIVKESDKNATVYYNDDESLAYIGPFILNYTSGKASVSIEGMAQDKIYGWTSKNSNGFKETEKIENLETNNENEIYIVVDAKELNKLSNVNIKIDLAYYTYKARMVFAVEPVDGAQNRIFFGAVKDEDSVPVEWEVQHSKDVSIQKVDESGNQIKTTGIIFHVYNSSNEYVGKLVTDENGKTGTIKLDIGQEYIIKELQNNAYGYKGCTITNAKIVSGKGTISLNNGEVKVTVNENTVISIENKPELGNLTIHKTGEGDKSLEGVEFVIWQANAYLKLNEESVTNPIVTSDEGLDITKYNITTVKTPEEATKFKTNASGNIVINNLEIYLGKGEKYEYWIQEVQNNNYGYQNMLFTEKDITVTGGNKLQVREPSRQIELDITENTILKQGNTLELGNLKLEKVDEVNSNIKLENVGFAIEISPTPEKEHAYIALYDKEGKVVPSIKGTATINRENIANENEYEVRYYSIDKSISEMSEEEKTSLMTNITTFITESNGILEVNNLEVYHSRNKDKYTYKLIEISNSNYGYNVESVELGNITLETNSTINKELTNKQELGSLKLEKVDEVNSNIKLENVGFAIEISPSPEKEYAYIALYDKEGKVVQSIKGTATINRENMANENEYEVRYYSIDKSISEMSEEEKTSLMTNITTFITENNGTLTVNNLKVYSLGNKDRYIYKLIETSNSNYGYDIESVELENVTIESGTTVNKVLTNKQTYTKLSGYVWIENPEGKSQSYDGVYTEANADIKLTDLYIMKDGKVELNTKAVTPVEIKLRNKTTGEFIKELPDDYTDGKYTFVDVEIGNLHNYEVVFVYNGFYYTTVVEQLDKDNGSKVKEVALERKSLSDKFETVKENGQIVGKDKDGTGTTNTVEYYKNGHTSKVSNLKFDVSLSANTTEAGYDLRKEFDSLKSDTSKVASEIENINMGIVLREQPKTSINEDIYSVLVEFEGNEYNYKYNGRQNFYENKNNDDIGVKFEQENPEKRYTRTVYASDIQAAKDQNKEIKVSVTYKVQIANESRTLSVMPKQLINYFDARYNIKAIGLNLDETTHEVTDMLTFSEPQVVEGHPEYKKTIIDFNQMIEATGSNIKFIYITFDIQRDAILDLLNQKSTYHNAVEILSYASYYGEDTSRVDGVQYISDKTEAGKLYAGIDKMSQPGNMEIVLVDHPSVDGTKILDTANFEDDTSSAPSLLLEAEESREISGTIWEDSATNKTNNQKLGDGIYSQNEKSIQNVRVELHKVDSNGKIGEVATYSNGENAVVMTDEKGNYKFGYYDEANQKHVGVLPGRYVIQYTYDNKSYIVGGQNINPNDYKSTIISSKVIENAFNGQNERWYVIEENNRYSDARDDIYLRPEYNSEIDANITITNSTYDTISVDSMKAYTPIMDIGIEFTEKDEENALVFEFIKEIKNIDFGIIERPDIEITIEKQITGLEVISQTGTNIIPKGDPSDPNASMQYVKTGLDGLVSAEIESKLLQGATLNLEYTITVLNNSEKDYLETDYYYYGRNGSTESTTRAKLVVDYLDATMSLESLQNDGIWQVRTLENLYDTEAKQGLVSEDVYQELKSGKYHMLTTGAFEEVGAGKQKSVKLYASKALAVSDAIDEENKVEIIELTGRRTIKDSIPGNYIPSEKPSEVDEDEVDLVITPPTGTTVNYIIYIIATVATFIILTIGIVIIKKKLVK